MQIEIGGVYLSKSGEIINIISEDLPYDGRRVFIDDIGRSYFGNGAYYYDESSKHSLVGEFGGNDND